MDGDGMREIWLVKPLVGTTGRAAGDWFAAAWSGGVLLQPPPPPLGRADRGIRGEPRWREGGEGMRDARCEMRDASEGSGAVRCVREGSCRCCSWCCWCRCCCWLLLLFLLLPAGGGLLDLSSE